MTDEQKEAIEWLEAKGRADYPGYKHCRVIKEMIPAELRLPAADKAKQFDVIVAAISCDGKKTLNPTLRDKLAEDIGEPDLLKTAKTPEELKTLLRGAPGYVEDLSKAAEARRSPTSSRGSTST